MKLRASYKYMDTRMLIGLAMFQIEDRPRFHVFFGSGYVSWSSEKQPTIALSSTKAKYKGASIVACEVVWLQKLLLDLG